MKKSKTFKLTFTAITAAMTAILAQVSIPLPSGIPFTLQTFSIALCGYLLGPLYGALSVAAYIALGAVGVPVFSNFTGGFQKLASLTGGFIIGFIPLAVMCGLSVKYKWKKKSGMTAAFFGIIGILVCHLCGIMQFSAVGMTDPINAFIICSLPYLIKDALSVIAAYYTAHAISKRI